MFVKFLESKFTSHKYIYENAFNFWFNKLNQNYYM